MLTLLFSIGSWPVFGAAKFPDRTIRSEMISKTVTEINRVDGEGLLPRIGRSMTWAQIARLLTNEAENAQDFPALGRVFRRLNAAYTNLHAHVVMDGRLVEALDVDLPIEFAADSIDRGSAASRFVISCSSLKNGPVAGDTLTKINGIAVQTWAEENFDFCKFPLREQCDLGFFENFSGERLSWHRDLPLSITVDRHGRELSFLIPVGTKLRQKLAVDRSLPCGVSPSRYPAFSLKFHGQNLCAFEAAGDPGTVILRIPSFYYENPTVLDLPTEIERFWKSYWQVHAANVRVLILDVIDNTGGDAPIPYYAILFDHDFQEQFVQFKKIAEFEDPGILKSLFWGDHGKEIWLANIRRDGSLSATATDRFLDPIPQFCADPSRDCRDGLFAPKKHGFQGEIKLLINPWCISSCVGFVSNIVRVLGARVKTYGLPDSGDSAYARLTLEIMPTKSHVSTRITPLEDADKPGPWIRQVVSVSRSTDANGNVLSGRPQHIDGWVARKWDESEEEWSARVVERSLSPEPQSLP